MTVERATIPGKATGVPITGAVTTSAGTGGTPHYPDAWCRLQRRGQTISIFRGDDGVNWTQFGATTWPDPADAVARLLPDTLYVGPEFSPENGNIDAPGKRGIWLASFRNYGDYKPEPSGATMTISFKDGRVEITYASGLLQSADLVEGPYTDVVGATSPYSVTPEGAKFYRLRL